MDATDDAVGLCDTCRWARTLSNRRGSRFYRCTRADFDPRFVKYPMLPVRACEGYEPAGSASPGPPERPASPGGPARPPSGA